MFTEVMDRFVEQSPVSVMFRGTLENAVTPELLDEIVDGNHLAATEHRIQELRTIGSGPLPGQALVVLDPARMLMIDVFPCEDGHAQERSLLPQVLPTVQANDLWIADRNFCTTDFLFGIAARSAKFIIRQHRQTLRCELLGSPRKIGRCATGVIYEQKVRLWDAKGHGKDVRRVTIQLKEPTRDGDTEIHLLTNLPPRDANARAVANLYLRRWTVENAFQELGQALHSEINTLGYPKAALLCFCVAILTYNAVSVVKSAMAAVHGPKAERRSISGYYLAGELAAAYHGMVIAVPSEEWTRHFGSLSAQELACILKALAAKVRPDRFRKNVRGPKKPRPKRSSGKRHPHVSTARILAQREPRKMHAVKA